MEGKHFLVVCDSFSKFMDDQMTTSVSSEATIELLPSTFCNFGLPDVIVSDNAAYFTSAEMETFLQKNGIRHITPEPYHPASNGLVERAVRAFKGLLKFAVGSLNIRLARFLHNCRRTIHTSTGKSPAELLFVKPFRSPLAFVSCRNLPQHNDPNDNRFPSLQLEDGVYARKFGRGEPWTEGKSVEVLGPRYCKAQLKGFGSITWKRHVDQLMRRYLGLEENLAENTKRPTPSQITAYDNRSSSRAIFLQENDGTWLSGRETRGNESGSIYLIVFT